MSKLLVKDLKPGQVVNHKTLGMLMIVIVHEPHPLYSDKCLVIWKSLDTTRRYFEFDCLSMSTNLYEHGFCKVSQTLREREMWNLEMIGE